MEEGSKLFNNNTVEKKIEHIQKCLKLAELQIPEKVYNLYRSSE